MAILRADTMKTVRLLGSDRRFEAISRYTNAPMMVYVLEEAMAATRAICVNKWKVVDNTSLQNHGKLQNHEIYENANNMILLFVFFFHLNSVKGYDTFYE